MVVTGRVGINIEHSGIDGHSFKRIIEELYFIPDGIDTGYPSIPTACWLDSPAVPVQLSFVLNDELTRKLSTTLQALDASRDNVDMKVCA